MPDAPLDAFHAHLALTRLSTPAECARLFRALIEPLGFDTFASGEVDLRDGSRNAFHLIDWPESWRKFYISSRMIERDPIVAELPHRTAPFTWSELRRERKLAQAGTEALDLAAAAGWTEGFVMPIHLGGPRIGLVSLAGHRVVESAAERAYLGLIALCLHVRMRALVRDCGFAMPPGGLTARETDCVHLVARGLTDKAIGQELGLSPMTVHDHVEKAKRRLNLRTRAELAAMAAAIGLGMP